MLSSMGIENLQIGPQSKLYTMLALGGGALIVLDAYFNWGIFAGFKPGLFGMHGERREYTLIGRVFRLLVGMAAFAIGVIGALILVKRHAW